MNKYLGISIAWAILILILTLTPGASVPNYKLFTYDKLGHFIIFFVQALLFVYGLHKRNNKTQGQNMAFGLIIPTLYGALIEYCQNFIPDRSMEWMDLIANCTGSLLGIVLFYISIRKN